MSPLKTIASARERLKAILGEGRGVAKNASWLVVLQLATYALPLITVPYLTRVFGVVTFGQVAAAATILSYLTIFVEWGANLGSTQVIAQKRAAGAMLGPAFWETLSARALLAALAAVVLGVLAILPPLEALAPLLLASFLGLVASALNVDWFLQGVERMGAFAKATLCARGAAVPLTFVFIHTPDDAWKAVALTGAVSLLAALYSLSVALREYDVGAPQAYLRGALRQIKEQRHLFTSRIAISLYTASTPLILTAIAGPHSAGLFAGAEKIARVVLQVLNQLSTAVFPRLNAMQASGSSRLAIASRKVLVIQLAIGAAGSIGLYVAAPLLVAVLLGRDFDESVQVLRWLACLPLAIALSNVLGVQVMIVRGMHRTFSAITLGSALLYLALCSALSASRGELGAAAAQVLCELLVLAVMVWVLWRNEADFMKQMLGFNTGKRAAQHSHREAS